MNAFVDTNILVYAADKSSPIPRKTRIARELLLQADLHLSVQVLNEFTVNARNPNKLNLGFEEELRWIESLLHYPVHSLTVTIYLRARSFQQKYGLSHWDCLILASAENAACQRLYSEDLNRDQRYEGIEVINPFEVP
ncbi:MAG: PIN domain-containing protein [Opitutales bacterium]|nr:PIN domain-containing protein [Opitutales bacterium]